MQRKVVLDIGCGENPRGTINIDVAKTRFCNIVSSAEYLPIKTDSVDEVICTEVLEHLNRPKKGLLEIRRVLKSGGVARISFPKPQFGNAIAYHFLDFVFNLPTFIFPKDFSFLVRAIRAIKNRHPRFYHKHIVPARLVSQYFSILQRQETSDVFLKYLNYWRPAKKILSNKPRLYVSFLFICKKRAI
jgi:ubiquinone/menaquinone biosynthesis C-methylase UbiE